MQNLLNLPNELKNFRNMSNLYRYQLLNQFLVKAYLKFFLKQAFLSFSYSIDKRGRNFEYAKRSYHFCRNSERFQTSEKNNRNKNVFKS